MRLKKHAAAVSMRNSAAAFIKLFVVEEIIFF
jgi:hypothetical protein